MFGRSGLHHLFLKTYATSAEYVERTYFSISYQSHEGKKRTRNPHKIRISSPKVCYCKTSFIRMQILIFAQRPVNSDKSPPKIFLFFLFFLSVSMFNPPTKNSLFSSLFPIHFLKKCQKTAFSKDKKFLKSNKKYPQKSHSSKSAYHPPFPLLLFI